MIVIIIKFGERVLHLISKHLEVGYKLGCASLFSIHFLNSLMIHEEKIKEITAVKEVWKSDLNCHKMW